MAQAPVDVKIRGIRQLEAGSRRLFQNIEQATDRDAIDASTDQVAATVRARVPRVTGRLAASVRAVDASNGRGHVEMGAGLEYARWIEYGGGARPYRKSGRFVLPTARRTARAFKKHCETATSQQIRSMHWPSPT